MTGDAGFSSAAPDTVLETQLPLSEPVLNGREGEVGAGPGPRTGRRGHARGLDAAVSGLPLSSAPNAAPTAPSLPPPQRLPYCP